MLTLPLSPPTPTPLTLHPRQEDLNFPTIIVYLFTKFEVSTFKTEFLTFFFPLCTDTLPRTPLPTPTPLTLHPRQIDINFPTVNIYLFTKFDVSSPKTEFLTIFFSVYTPPLPPPPHTCQSTRKSPCEGSLYVIEILHMKFG